jgi:hypothetical protein
MNSAEKKILLEFLQTLFLPEDIVCVGHIKKEDEYERHVFKQGKQNILAAIEKYSNEKYGAVCICPNPLKEKARSKTIENIKTLNCLFADIDGTSFDISLLPTPHYIFRRGSKNYHYYWLIERVENTEESYKIYKKALLKIIDILGSDNLVSHSAAYLRQAYTFYDKKPKQKGYELYEKNDLPRYKLEEFLPEDKGTKKSKGANKEAKEVQVKTDEIEHFLLTRKPTKIAAGEGRSRFLYYFGLDCYSWGIEQDKALALAFQYNEKICDPPERDRTVKHQIASAYKYARGNFGEYKEKSKVDGAVKAFEAYQTDNAVREFLQNWVYVMESERFINLETGVELTTTAQIENFLAHLTGKGVTLKHVFRKQLVRVCDRMDFRPDLKKRFYRSKNVLYFNRFGGLKEFEGNRNDIAVKLFQEHLKLLTTSKEEFAHLQNFLAYVIQNPGKKLDHAVLIISKVEGLGKSLLQMLFENMLQSKKDENYVVHVENQEIMDKNTDFMAGKLLCFVHELAQGDRYATMNKLKDLITGKSVRIIAKYARTYTIRNTVNFIFFSNLIDAIKISKYDRRLFVVYNDKERRDEEYYEKIVKAFSHDYAAIRDYLFSIDLRKFNPNKKPPSTRGKEQLQEQSESELSLFLGQLERDGVGPFENKLLTIPEILSYVQSAGPMNIQSRTSYKQIQAWLIQKDYIMEDIDKKLKIDKKRESVRVKSRIYYKKDYTPGLGDFIFLAKRIAE